jgi:hypothetical protein
MNNPVPMGKGSGKIYIGAGTGIKAHIDSVSMDGTVYFSDKISPAPVLSFGLQNGYAILLQANR